MASQSAGPIGPFWSNDAQQHYWYDEVHDRLIHQDGTKVQRPMHIPRSALLPPSIGYEFSGSPPREDYAYTSSSSRALDQLTASKSKAVDSGFSATISSLDNLAVNDSVISQKAQPSTAKQTSPADTSIVKSTDGVVTKLIDVPKGKIVQVFDPRSRVVTKYQTGPAEDITDPQLLYDSRGRGAYRKLMGNGSEGETEQLFATFQVRSTPRKFFTVGKVFMVLWSEPAGQTLVTGGVSTRRPGTAEGRYGEMVFSKVRRFVVIREAATYCSALPIATYGTQGVGKSNVTKSEHAIIHTGRSPPAPMRTEEPLRGELGMRPDPIRVDPDDREDKLDPRSRIDFGKVHTIQHNIKVKSYGKVNEKSAQALIQQFNNCWYAPSVPTVPSASATVPLRVFTETRTTQPGARRESVSSGRRSQPTSEDGGSGSHAPGRDNEGGSSRSEIARRRELQRQQYWAAIEQLENSGYSRENAIAVLNARLAQKAAAAINRDDDDDDEDDEDD